MRALLLTICMGGALYGFWQHNMYLLVFSLGVCIFILMVDLVNAVTRLTRTIEIGFSVAFRDEFQETYESVREELKDEIRNKE